MYFFFILFVHRSSFSAHFSVLLALGLGSENLFRQTAGCDFLRGMHKLRVCAWRSLGFTKFLGGPEELCLTCGVITWEPPVSFPWVCLLASHLFDVGLPLQIFQLPGWLILQNINNPKWPFDPSAKSDCSPSSLFPSSYFCC